MMLSHREYLGYQNHLFEFQTLAQILAYAYALISVVGLLLYKKITYVKVNELPNFFATKF